MTGAPSRSQPDTNDFAMLREVEIAWLSAELSRAIESLAYPVGMGVAPQAHHVESAAKKLFDRYAKMIEMAHKAAERRP